MTYPFPGLKKRQSTNLKRDNWQGTTIQFKFDFHWMPNKSRVNQGCVVELVDQEVKMLPQRFEFMNDQDGF